MVLKELIEKHCFSIYAFSKLSGVPKTTLLDLCSGRTKIRNSKAETIQKIAFALKLKMEEIMNLNDPIYMEVK